MSGIFVAADTVNCREWTSPTKPFHVYLLLHTRDTDKHALQVTAFDWHQLAILRIYSSPPSFSLHCICTQSRLQMRRRGGTRSACYTSSAHSLLTWHCSGYEGSSPPRYRSGATSRADRRSIFPKDFPSDSTPLLARNPCRRTRRSPGGSSCRTYIFIVNAKGTSDNQTRGEGRRSRAGACSWWRTRGCRGSDRR